MLARLALFAAIVAVSLVVWLARPDPTRSGAAQDGTPVAGGPEVAATLAAILGRPQIAVTAGPVVLGPEVIGTMVAELSGPEVAATVVDAIGAGSAEACDEAGIQPRSPMDLAVFAAESGEAIASPPGTPRPASIELPVGEQADAETASAVAETLRAEAACFNADKVLHAFAYSTDERFRRDPTLISVPDRIDRIEVVAVTDVSELDDGRVGAVCVSTVEPGGPTANYCIFAWDGTRWLIDETMPLGGA